MKLIVFNRLVVNIDLIDYIDKSNIYKGYPTNTPYIHFHLSNGKVCSVSADEYNFDNIMEAITEAEPYNPVTVEKNDKKSLR